MDIKFENPFPKTLGFVMSYKGKKYSLWHVNSFGKAQLMKPDGTKFSGTPEVAKLKWLYQIPIVHFNRVDYANRLSIKWKIATITSIHRNMFITMLKPNVKNSLSYNNQAIAQFKSEGWVKSQNQTAGWSQRSMTNTCFG